MFVYWNNSSLNPYWSSNLRQNWNIQEYSSFNIHVPRISGKQGQFANKTKMFLSAKKTNKKKNKANLLDCNGTK